MPDHRHRPPLKPPEPWVKHVRFDPVLRRVKHKEYIYVTGNPVLNTSTDATITSRPVLVTNTTQGTTVTLDMFNAAATFTCNPGDVGTVTPLGDVNSTGQGPAGPAFSWTAPTEAPPPPPLPATQTVVGVNFTP